VPQHGGRLAAAVTAGGLGMFGIGLVDWVIRKEPGLFDAALATRPGLISVSFGTDLSWVSRVHDAGIAAATQVYNSGDAAGRLCTGAHELLAGWSQTACT
jgi:nitronate monooxygenase